MRKSYLVMFHHDNAEGAGLVPVETEEMAKEGIEFLSSFDVTDWAVAYEFQGDDFRTVAHYER